MRVGRLRWIGRGVLIAGITAAILTPLITRDATSQAAQMGDVRFGWPLAFISQNQDSLDPPFPYEARLRTPLEYPTAGLPGSLIVDAAALSLPGLAIFWVARRRQAREMPGNRASAIAVEE